MHPRYVSALALAAFTLAGCAALGGTVTGERLQRARQSPQYKADRFANPLPMSEEHWGLIDVLGMLREWSTTKAKRVPDAPVPVVTLVRTDFAAPATDLAVRWLGHSTVVVEIEGKRILTDPVWSDSISPVGFAGPGRFFSPLAELEALLPLDAVVISHDHFDHLDYPTIVRLKDQTQFYVPLGVGTHLEAWGVAPERVHELDWWQSASLGGVTLVCTPARHFSGRRPWARNDTLWASWSLVGARRRVFFSGDSGLFHELADIGARYGPFDLTLIDSGAYNRRWPDVHMGPEQAVLAHRALRGDVLLPIHWGLFSLAPHAWVEPIERIRVLAAREGVRVAQPRPGELVTLTAPLPTAKWWPDVPWLRAEQAPVASTHIDAAWRAAWSKPAVPLAGAAPESKVKAQ